MIAWKTREVIHVAGSRPSWEGVSANPVEAPVVRSLLGWLALAMAGCVAPPTMPSLDATWVCSWYVLWVHERADDRTMGEESIRRALLAVGDLCQRGLVEVVGIGELAVGWDLGPITSPVLLLAGKPEALAAAHGRLADAGGGVAFLMARKQLGSEGCPEAPQGMSILLLPQDRSEDVSKLIESFPQRSDTSFTGDRDFHLGATSAGPTCRLLVVEAPQEVLHLVTMALRERGVPIGGFLYCQPFLLPRVTGQLASR